MRRRLERGRDKTFEESLICNTYTQILTQFKLEKDSAERLPESMWKGTIYLITWTWSAYLTHKWDTMFDLASHWNSELTQRCAMGVLFRNTDSMTHFCGVCILNTAYELSCCCIPHRAFIFNLCTATTCILPISTSTETLKPKLYFYG